MNGIQNKSELKFKIEGTLNFFLKDKKYTQEEIVLVYIDLKNLTTKLKIKNLTNNINLEDFKECRISIVDNNKCYLTLKSESDLGKVEFEKELNMIEVRNIISDGYINSICKTRYTINVINEVLNVTIDNYHDRDLIIAKISFDNKKINKNDLEKFMFKYFKYFKATNVTYDKSFKSVNLAK